MKYAENIYTTPIVDKLQEVLDALQAINWALRHPIALKNDERKGFMQRTSYQTEGDIVKKPAGPSVLDEVKDLMPKTVAGMNVDWYKMWTDVIKENNKAHKRIKELEHKLEFIRVTLEDHDA